ncbi:hypothetical protein ARC272_18800 [Pantoea ananatis]|nr:hypothetical protein [Pantoea ananatis]PZD60279.1 hypothetical protein ARC272_18800 [Pantoea ananatis]
MENQHSGLALMQKRPKRHPNTFYEAVMGTKQIINRGVLTAVGFEPGHFQSGVVPRRLWISASGLFFP